MPFSVDGLTVQIFQESGWRELVDSADERVCSNYMQVFHSASEEAGAAGDEKRANLFSLLRDITSMYLKVEDPAEPLKPLWQSDSGRSAITSDFDSALDFLDAILPCVNDPELGARIADVIWLRKRDFKAARLATQAYIDTVDPNDIDYWRKNTDRIERAIDIAASTNQRDQLDHIMQQVERWLSSVDPARQTSLGFLPVALMKLLLSRKHGNASHYSSLAETFAKHAEQHNDWHLAREYWNLQCEWFRSSKNEEGARAARIRYIETYVSEAESRVRSGGSTSYAAATHFLESALHALRSLGGCGKRAEEVHRKLLAYQGQAVRELGHISHSMDASELVNQAIKSVAGKSLFDAIFALVLLGRSPSVSQLREQAERHREEFVFSRIFPVTYLNAMGKTIARKDAANPDDSEDETSLHAEMYRNANLCRSIQAQAVIEPARNQIIREHEIRVADLLSIMQESPIVPPGRELLYAHGLHAGFRGDFVTAAHLLAPQFEESIRHILRSEGVITSGFDADGIQDERDLNRTLRLPEFTEPLAGILGADLLFDLRGLLVERFGANLRNDLAHGLLEYNSFYSAPCVYFWWLTLRLCCLPIILALKEESYQQSGADNTRDESP